MSETENKEMIAKAIVNLKAEIEKIKNKTFSIYFYVYDTKGAPNGELIYIYETAYELSQMGYNVKMLHSDNDFVGAESWLDKKYTDLKHYNMTKDGVNVSPADLLVIPEIFANVMYKTFVEDKEKGIKRLPCKRVMLLNNYSYLVDTIQPGASPEQYDIRDCIVTCKALADRVNEFFPSMRTYTVSKCIDDEFFNNDTAFKTPVISVAVKDNNDVKRITSEFYWKYPSYRWVAFAPLANLSRETVVESLRDSVATVWVDDKTDFGISALEAMASGNIVIGKIPDGDIEWMSNEDGSIRKNGVWCYNLEGFADIIANVIQSYLHNNIPDEMYSLMEETVGKYKKERFVDDVKSVYVDKLISDRQKELEMALKIFEDKNKEVKNS